ncbi:MAG: HNH endonuclease [Planctomycetes bacterium]|nr:HNH endonuclease [Planctomycetota bacterium]
MSYAPALDASVLVVNRLFMAVQVVSARRAFTLLCKECAQVVSVDDDDKYNFYDLKSWIQVSQLKAQFEEYEQDDWVHTVSVAIRVPKVIRLLFYDRFPAQTLKFNRRNIFARDESRCQYCGKKFPTSELSLEHIIPRSRGGESTWKNVVCACTGCNKKKGGRTPQEAHMKLIRKPVKPRRNPLLKIKLQSQKYESWKQFLDNAYWSVELE